MKKPVIFVAGSSADASPASLKKAEEVGKEIARNNCVLLCGGMGGVMEAACKGSRQEKCLSVCVIPSAEKSNANQYCDVVIASGMGFARNFLLAQSCDAMILVQGQVGTLTEAAAGYFLQVPVIALDGTGGTADKVKGTELDKMHRGKILSAKTPKEAVQLSLKEINQRK